MIDDLRSMMNIYMKDGDVYSIPADAEWTNNPAMIPPILSDTHIRVDAPGYAYILNKDMIKAIIINKPEQSDEHLGQAEPTVYGVDPAQPGGDTTAWRTPPVIRERNYDDPYAHESPVIG